MQSGEFKVEVEPIDATQALAFWHDAPRATAFTHPELLGAMAHDVRWWLARESGRPTWVWPVCLDADGRVRCPELCYYVGPFRIGDPDRSPRRRLAMDVAIHGEMLNVLYRAHGRLAWSTTPGEHDLRPWLWNSVEGRSPVAMPRYTAVLDGIVSESEEDLLSRFSAERRRDVRAAAAKCPVLLPPARLEQVFALYRDTLAATGAVHVAERRLGEVEALVGLAARGHGRMMTLGIGDDGIARAVWIILVAKGHAYEALGASDHSWREARLNGHGRLQCIMAAQAMDAARYDFVGANSLQRGSDKHSYGAEAELFFDVTFGAS